MEEGSVNSALYRSCLGLLEPVSSSSKNDGFCSLDVWDRARRTVRSARLSWTKYFTSAKCSTSSYSVFPGPFMVLNLVFSSSPVDFLKGNFEQSRPLRSHARHSGFRSSHFFFRILHCKQPVFVWPDRLDRTLGPLLLNIVCL